MLLTMPEFCLVALIGASGSGKSSFARKHFGPTEVLSSDYCRALVRDDESAQDATDDAFDVLFYIARKRLAARRLTVIDATNVRREDRERLVKLAREYHALPVAVVFDLPEKLCQERNVGRPERDFGPHVVRNQSRLLRRSLRGLRREGFRYDYRLSSPEEVEAAEVERQRLWTDRRDEHGPFDIIGDVHGCFDELRELLGELGYQVSAEAEATGLRYRVVHPEGRRAVFLGDLVDRGPRIPDCLRLAMDMVETGVALCVPGNHEIKLLKKLQGRDVKMSHGLAESVKQLEGEPPEFHDRIAKFIDGLVSHFMLDDGKLVVAHAGMKEEMQGRSSGAVRSFALFGETTGETDEFGLPVRYNWAGEYRGKAAVVYGHTPVPEPEWLNRTICLDTGCVFGGRLTALRYPEKELVSVPARQTYFEPLRPLDARASDSALSAQQAHDDLLDIDDVRGKRIIPTRLRHNVTVREENATAALEVMSRFAANPKWLIYLPPTMAPSDTTREEGLLEHPEQAFNFYRKNGVERVICEEKHMGSRAVTIVCRDEETALRRFGVEGEGVGIVYTRTGRRFFNDANWESQFIARVRDALDARGFWEKLETDWVCLDAELMPWSAKAQALLLQQYGPTAAAARIGLKASLEALEQGEVRGVETGALRQRSAARLEMAAAYSEAYRRYCWPVSSVDDFKLAPFHVLATEGAVHADKDHGWHMATVADLCAGDEKILTATPYKDVDLHDEASCAAATAWWQDVTGAGGEGMVVKPWDFVVVNRKGLVQPALKCRGQEYLRIIYGPEYTAPEHLERLRERSLGAKRSLALREFALGIEGLERFVNREPLRRVHECAFAVLAMESEPVDPRL
jgi:protein phosphatase